MHILILASGYPTEYSLNQGIFFRDQAESLARDRENQVAVIAVVPISGKAVMDKMRWSFGLKTTMSNHVRTFVYTFLNIPKVHKYRVLKGRKRGMKLLKEYIQQFGKPDIIHLHGFQGGLFAQAAKKKYGIPYVITEHSTQFIDDIVSPDLESYAKSTFEHSDAAIAVSLPFAEIMTKRYGRTFQYIPNVVDTDVFELNPTVQKNAEFTFFNAAAFVVEKNHPMLLEAFSMVLKNYPNTRLRLAGKGYAELDMQQYAKELRIEQKVDFLGLLPRKEIVKEMQQMDAFVLSSKVETFGVVLIEALSCGKPAVSTYCFGPESIITSPEIGILCNQNAADLAFAMEQMIQERSNYDSALIRKHVIDQFSNDTVINQLMQVYQSVISKYNV
ncbi:glycosyltransferase [Fluviicola taffensis]|uniref:glycosyltransferase n=1 Tax=Fluviicola taffensis TaxID=191579 RepID=UPI00313802CA